MGERRTGVTVAVAMLTGVAAALFAGCSPQPQPTFTPTPAPAATAFASDEEAFAAAEATYRAYVDAGNAERRGDRDAEPAKYLSGALLRAERESAAKLDELGIRLSGDIRLHSFEVHSSSTSRLNAIVCIDVSRTRVIDENGSDITPQSRADILGLEVLIVWEGTHMTVDESSPNESTC